MKLKLGGDAADGQSLSHSPWAVTVGIKQKKKEMVQWCLLEVTPEESLGAALP